MVRYMVSIFGKLSASFRCLSVRCVGQLSEASVLRLRSYQEECIQKCIDSITKKKIRRIGVSLATGGGKTVVFVNLLQRLRSLVVGKHCTLILVNRRELAFQAVETIKRFYPSLHVELEMGKFHAKVAVADVVVASMSTLIRRLEKYRAEAIDLIIIDEAHHAVAKSYIEVLKHFGAGEKDSRIPVVGFSATFERADRKALSRVMDEIAFHKGVLEMIEEKWLCEGKFTVVDLNVDLLKVDIAGPDFKVSSLSQVINTEKANQIVLNTYEHKREKHGLRSTLLFGVDIAHVKSLCALFQDNGIKAQYVTGKTRPSERDALVQNFCDGKIEVLMNCGIFTEGTDIPNIDCLILCRPTRSRTLLVQMIGRGLRKHHSKQHCHVIDFVSSSKVGVVSIPSLAGIDNMDNTLHEASLQDLDAMRKDIETKKAIAEEERRLAAAKQEVYQKKIDQKLNSLISSLTAVDLTLTSFDDFKTYYELVAKGDKADLTNLSPSIKELKLFKESIYAWVKYGRNSWAMDLGYGHHLRINRVRSKADSKAYEYELKRYRPLPHSENKVIKYSSRSIGTGLGLVDVFSAVDAVINKIQEKSQCYSYPMTNLSKCAPWRYMQASEKQKVTIYSILKKEHQKNKDRMNVPTLKDIHNYVSNLSKGDAAKILFAFSLAPVYPKVKLLATILYKAAASRK